ncbi:hypothetical protein LOE09_09015 [Pseudosulfitobacter pseudonitzschiae]|nr:hypothetical protein [Pseudosulfitobacter pseudonitzschiae]MBM1817173.1 hypothetical protein [Pseudosulfitobacter pseudonitzschiae]MBM1843897.1 hypothetical protein [Pseudosulfitobacter pseudonitzschiae]MBM1858447.1 hypothetical protein [Pseudosulfitobacter pseudonitzschiae]MBM1901893.1 hypothetical protein [Pseudosulfitobacter pseudonitzschiae]MBM1911693.1 hypothetical protein [Pseudosulfitobacter pseudonitzschiae]
MLHAVGMGCPDIIVGHRGVNTLMEIKDGSKPPSARKTTTWQDTWHAEWRGQVCIVKSPTEALNAIGLAPKRGTIS